MICIFRKERETTRIQNRSPLIALFAGAAAIGLAPIFVRLSETGPIATGFWRVALAVPVFLLLSRLPGLRSPDAPGSKRVRSVLILAGLFFATDLAFWNLSIQYTLVANATLLANLTPIVVAAGSVLLFRETLGRQFYLGLLVALTGSAFLAGASYSFGGGRLVGDGLAVVTALFYGCYLLTVGRLRGSQPTVRIMLWSSAVAAPALLFAAVLLGERLWPLTPAGWMPLLGLALVSQVGGQGLIAYSFRHLPAAFGSVGLLVQTIVAAVVAWFLFGEALGGLEFTGAALIIAGIVMARRDRKPAAG